MAAYLRSDAGTTQCSPGGAPPTSSTQQGGIPQSARIVDFRPRGGPAYASGGQASQCRPDLPSMGACAGWGGWLDGSWRSPWRCCSPRARARRRARRARVDPHGNSEASRSGVRDRSAASIGCVRARRGLRGHRSSSWCTAVPGWPGTRPRWSTTRSRTTYPPGSSWRRRTTASPPQVDPLAQADDVAAALAYVQKHAADWGGGDPNRIVLMGHSAGGHLVSLVTADPAYRERAGASPWLGTVSLDGAAFDVTRIMAAPPHLDLYDPVFAGKPDLQRAASPTLVIAGTPPPVLLICAPPMAVFRRSARRPRLRRGGTRTWLDRDGRIGGPGTRRRRHPARSARRTDHPGRRLPPLLGGAVDLRPVPDRVRPVKRPPGALGYAEPTDSRAQPAANKGLWRLVGRF